MNSIKVSVIVPVYNSEKFLSECLDSLVKQSLKEIEILCVNDGSTDGSLKILKNYAKKDKRIKIINQENKGQSGARNNALRAAVGEYIGFVDSDDFVATDFFEKLYLGAQEENADISVGNIIRVNNGKKENVLIFNKTKVAENTNDIFKLLNIPTCCYIWNRLYKREFIMQNNLFFKEGVVYEDIIWSTIVASKAEKAVSVEKANYYYVYNENSTVATTEQNSKKQKDQYEAFMFYNKYIREHKIKAPMRWQKVTKIRIFGLNILKIKELPNIKRKYYFCGICIASVTLKNNF